MGVKMSVATHHPKKVSDGDLYFYFIFLFFAAEVMGREEEEEVLAAILCVRLCWAASSHNQTSLSTNGWVATEREKLDAP
jgi:hypothetical protein